MKISKTDWEALWGSKFFSNKEVVSGYFSPASQNSISSVELGLAALHSLFFFGPQ